MGLIEQIQNEYHKFYRLNGYPPTKIIFYDVEVLHSFMKEISESSIYYTSSIYNNKFLGMEIVKRYKKGWGIE